MCADLSKSETARLSELWERLSVYRETAVGFDEAVKSPDGPKCPIVNVSCTLGAACHGMTGTYEPCGPKPQ